MREYTLGYAAAVENFLAIYGAGKMDIAVAMLQEESITRESLEEAGASEETMQELEAAFLAMEDE